MDIKINVPVKQHIYRFLIANFGLSYRISTNDAIGIILYNLLKNPVKNTCDSERASQYPCNYPILVPEGYFFDFGVNSLCATGIVHFNNFFESLMKFAFLLQVKSLMAPRPKDMSEAYNQFIDEFYYDEEKQTYEDFERIFDTLKKYHYRFRKRNKKLSFSSF